MDSFGRLPSDVISEITKFNDVLEITFVSDRLPFYNMRLKTLHYQCNFWYIAPIFLINDIYLCEMDELNNLKNIIDNKYGGYQRFHIEDDFSFSIRDNITISTSDATMILPMSCLEDFIAGLQKLYTILDAYPKY